MQVFARFGKISGQVWSSNNLYFGANVGQAKILVARPIKPWYFPESSKNLHNRARNRKNNWSAIRVCFGNPRVFWFTIFPFVWPSRYFLVCQFPILACSSNWHFGTLLFRTLHDYMFIIPGQKMYFWKQTWEASFMHECTHQFPNAWETVHLQKIIYGENL